MNREQETVRIEALARCISAREGATDHANDCAAVDTLFKYLDILDRKASSLITLNSFLTPVATFFVFRPLGLFEPGTRRSPVAVDYPLLLVGGAALLTSFLVICTALLVIRIKWNFLANVRKEQNYKLGPEITKLCDEAALRQIAIGWIWKGTFLAFILNFLAIFLTAVGDI